MMSIPLSKTYQPSASRPSLTRTSPFAGIVMRALEGRYVVEGVEMGAVNGISQCGVLAVLLAIRYAARLLIEVITSGSLQSTQHCSV
jgi:hypothetical protein